MIDLLVLPGSALASAALIASTTLVDGLGSSRRLIDVDRPRADHLEVVADGLDGDPLSGADVEDLIAARGLTDVDIARRHDLTIVRNLLNTISLGRFRSQQACDCAYDKSTSDHHRLFLW